MAPGGVSFQAIGDRITSIQMGAWSWSALIWMLVVFSCRFTVAVEGPPQLVEAARKLTGRIDVEVTRPDGKPRPGRSPELSAGTPG